TAVAALALTASGGVGLVTAASPATAVTPHDTPAPSDGYSLSISVAQKSIEPGASDTVSGVLTKAGTPQPGDTIYLRARANGRHQRVHRVGSATTGTDGSVSFTVTPQTNTHYRLVYRPGARSKVATVHILRASSLSIRTRATRFGDAIEGRLLGRGHGLPGRKVMLQERAAGSDAWTTLTTKRTHRRGVVVFRIAAPSAPEEFQLVFTGGPNFNGCQSGVVTIGS
ncbi:MAG: hypothetical protein ACTHK4_02920, partial [Mycobacteriales bacterium]